MKFYVKPQVFCPECFQCLTYEAGQNDVRVVAHPRNDDCEYSEQKFTAPEVELEPCE